MYIGIDIGSTNAKVAVLDDNENIIFTKVVKTGFNSKETAESLINDIKKEFGFSDKDKIVATGYGRVSVDLADKTVTEISCHAKGAIKIFNKNDLVIIDIGGQDTKVIDVDNCQVKDFIMNDKCSAGTGRFLDVMSKTMDMTIKEMCELAETGGGVSISSLCTVFAESEVISLIGKSEKKENIANAIVMSIINKVSSQVKRIDYKNKTVCLTGGLSDIDFIKSALSKELDTEVQTHEYGKFAGSIGAAIFAKSIK